MRISGPHMNSKTKHTHDVTIEVGHMWDSEMFFSHGLAWSDMSMWFYMSTPAHLKTSGFHSFIRSIPNLYWTQRPQTQSKRLDVWLNLTWFIDEWEVNVNPIWLCLHRKGQWMYAHHSISRSLKVSFHLKFSFPLSHVLTVTVGRSVYFEGHYQTFK